MAQTPVIEQLSQPPGAAPVRGQFAPYFKARASNNPSFYFDTTGGRFIVLAFIGSAHDPAGRQHLDQLLALERFFDDANVCFFGVTCDPEDEKVLVQRVPGIRYFWDTNRNVSTLYGAQTDTGYRRQTVVVDPAMRVLAVVPFDQDRQAHGEAVKTLIERLPRPDAHAGVAMHAPVLIAPRIFESRLCKELTDLYDRHGGQESGFMREVEGRTVAINDYRHKRRTDHVIEDAAIRAECEQMMRSRLFPQIEKAFMFRPTRIERYIVARYAADPGGHFRPHRDNRTKGTAHRKFAVSINLNAEDYEGGDLRFPEYGSRVYRAPTGGAVVFSCSLLHECTSMVKGARYCFLPFLYDEESARLREENMKYLGIAPEEAQAG
jgi:predicted 2-oxoglutarate/Fe(II)-dependent dioxygenase YbiX/peroxiredoxin